MISNVDMSEEKELLQNMKKKEFMNEEQNEKLLEVKVDSSQQESINDESINQTYKMIVDSHNISNNEDFCIEDDSSEGEDEEDHEEYFEQDNSEDKMDNILNKGEIEPIAEEDGEESKYMPTPQKQVSSKMGTMNAVECVKALKAKETEKRLDLDENKINFKSADAQKPKAIIKENKGMQQKNLPPKVPNRSSTRNENPNKNAIPSSYMKNYHKHVPSTTKASTVSETPKSVCNSTQNHSKAINKNSFNESKMSSEGEKLTPENCRALMLYEKQTVASKHKKQEAYKNEDELPAWGIQSINSKNALAKRVTSATTRSTTTPRA